MCLPAGPPLPRPLTSPPCILGGGTLRTCVLRPPGIYGPEEQRHLPRVAVCQPGPGPEAQDEPGCCGNGSGPFQPAVSLWSNIVSLGLSSGRCPYPSGLTRNKGLSVHLPGLGIGRGVPELRPRRGRGSLWAPQGPKSSAHAVPTRSPLEGLPPESGAGRTATRDCGPFPPIAPSLVRETDATVREPVRPDLCGGKNENTGAQQSEPTGEVQDGACAVWKGKRERTKEMRWERKCSSNQVGSLGTNPGMRKVAALGFATQISEQNRPFLSWRGFCSHRRWGVNVINAEE